MIPFELAEPPSLEAAIGLLNPHDPTIRPMAGGTALMLMMKAGVFHPVKLISLRKIESRYSRVEFDGNELHIGAMTTLGTLERSSEIQKHAPVITRTLRTLSNVRVRNVATIGGALAHADPHMDLPPVLISLGATLTVTGPKGEREIAVEELCSGYYETVLKADELITGVHIPVLGSKSAAYYKVTTGSVDDWPALGIAARIEHDGSLIKSARLVASAATNRATRLKSAEALLVGKSVDDELLIRASEIATEDCEFIADVRGTVPYKRELMKVYLRRAVRAALNTGTVVNGRDH